MIYLIGLGWRADGGEFQYRSWHLPRLDEAAVTTMISDFTHFANSLCLEYECYGANMYHWSSAERNWLDSANALTLDPPDALFTLCDEMVILSDDAVCIAGTHGYSLKNISKGLAQLSLIPDHYANLVGRCGDGMDAMIIGAGCYSQSDPTADPRFADIVEYNRIDCLCMAEILEYLRNNH